MMELILATKFISYIIHIYISLEEIKSIIGTIQGDIDFKLSNLYGRTDRSRWQFYWESQLRKLNFILDELFNSLTKVKGESSLYEVPKDKWFVWYGNELANVVEKAKQIEEGWTTPGNEDVLHVSFLSAISVYIEGAQIDASWQDVALIYRGLCENKGLAPLEAIEDVGDENIDLLNDDYSWMSWERDRIHSDKFPYLLVRVAWGVYAPITIPPNLKTLNSQLAWAKDFSSSKNLNVALVLDQKDCYYVEPNDSATRSNEPPSGGTIINWKKLEDGSIEKIYKNGIALYAEKTNASGNMEILFNIPINPD